jgi:uncharacterized oligopeptide transporter (OPT) family protein
MLAFLSATNVWPNNHTPAGFGLATCAGSAVGDVPAWVGNAGSAILGRSGGRGAVHPIKEGEFHVTDHAVSNAEPRSELTVRGVVLGVIVTLVFTAANVFFGLKIGLTVATSIPAAVISMALLRGFKDSTVQENNIVQTIASAAGTLSAMAFVLPGLLMVGWWSGFPYWTSFAVCALGGILGVMYSIPLRRALVTGSDLPFPEGVACAEVLKVGSPGAAATEQGVEESRTGLLAVIWGAIVAAAFSVIVATRVFASDVAQYFRFGGDGAVRGRSSGRTVGRRGDGRRRGHRVGVGCAALFGVGRRRG